MTDTTYQIPPKGTNAPPATLVSGGEPVGTLANPLVVSNAGGSGSGLADTLWTDDTGAYFVRVDNGSAITWTTISGGASSAPGTGARPAGGAGGSTIDRVTYQATAGGTGYSSGDIIDHFATLNSAGTPIASFWYNATTAAVITSPSSANITALQTGVATQTTLAAVLAKLTSDPSTATLQGTGNTALASILAKLTADPATQTTLAAILAKLTASPSTSTLQSAMIALLPPAFGSNLAASSLSVALASDDPAVASLAQIYAAILAGNTTLDSQLTALTDTPAYLPPLPLLTTNDLTGVLIDTTSTSDVTLVAAAGVGIKNRMYRVHFTVSGATTIKIYDDVSASGAVLDRFDVPAAGGFFDLSFDGRSYWTSQANKPLILKSSNAVQISGRGGYAQGA